MIEILIMLTIDCKDVKPIMHELLVYVSDQVAAIPAIKINEFVLSPINDTEEIDRSVVIASIHEFLDSIGQIRKFDIVSSGDVIAIRSVNGNSLERETSPNAQMFSCVHCGFMTRYEVEHQNHMKLHYL